MNDKRYRRTRRERCRFRRERPFASRQGRRIGTGRPRPYRRWCCWGRVFRRTSLGRALDGEGVDAEPRCSKGRKMGAHRFKYERVVEDCGERASGTKDEYIARSLARSLQIVDATTYFWGAKPKYSHARLRPLEPASGVRRWR